MELLDRVTHLFKQNTPVYLGEMQDAIAHRDGVALRKSAHTLLSSLELLGAFRARDLAARLQTIAESGDFDEASKLLAELEAEAHRICTGLASCSSASEYRHGLV